ncbi:class C beta-lactamase [Yersinia mollaretii]|uniref:Beta-lactamase n=1 Tax=Yersinia mollaretii (strain ATCC 43969 / DSM 18520 / CIP 103324 / CNY 7263 / WAIP 204) TaxID=349967 RepID=A0ABM9YAC4_YERMW|nr:class C beta-lactamase [Yersinia mollaretii]EEQ10764.1 Beta-lactamase [Yersinia mollaretii ATCC 43969]MDN0111029.1 class C beta-lactamase [Yersinia mollaretii]PJE86088.1 class C beta-lactamase [Yersinia mollaretii]QKJ03265.1 beta-lactamase [Yersinia mollaretii ATCC 43969]CQD42363.1 beta-lactamase [Yersinia mollaretii]
MMKKSLITTLVLTAIAASPLSTSAQTKLTEQQVAAIVNDTLKPLIEKQDIPGMAVAVFYDGKPQFFNYGVADIKAGTPVTENTLFELGSVSKTFTGVAGEYAMQTGIMNLNDPVTDYAPELTGSQWKAVKMLHLATYTAGGLPLQLPDSVTDQKSLWQYYQQWQPEWAPGEMRNYSNASIGLFGALAVKRSQLTFEEYMKKSVFQPLKLNHTFITVPESMLPNYAWGYKEGQPMRVTLGMLGEEAYGVKSTTKDMVRFMQANMNPESLPVENDKLKQALIAAQSRYFQAGEIFQGLGWEMYNWPIDPQRVIADSGNDVALKPRKAKELLPPPPAVRASWVHKTGATNGFGAYIVFIPEQNIGIVMLANKNYPNPVRVQAAYNILQALR